MKTKSVVIYERWHPTIKKLSKDVHLSISEILHCAMLDFLDTARTGREKAEISEIKEAYKKLQESEGQ